MIFKYLIPVVAVVATIMVINEAATIPPPTGPISNHTGGEIELFRNKQKCTAHSQCSCTGGIPVCWEGYCQCIYTQYLCFEHRHCGEHCGSGVGICLSNACKCYNLVEDKRASDSVSPWVNEDVP